MKFIRVIGKNGLGINIKAEYIGKIIDDGEIRNIIFTNTLLPVETPDSEQSILEQLRN